MENLLQQIYQVSDDIDFLHVHYVFIICFQVNWITQNSQRKGFFFSKKKVQSMKIQTYLGLKVLKKKRKCFKFFQHIIQGLKDAHYDHLQ